MSASARLGILGGMGPQATQVFYQRILERTDATRDQDHLPTLIFSDTGIPDRTQAILHGDPCGCFDRLLSDAKLLESAGCTALAIPCNTSHFFVDRLQASIGIPILHMIRATARTVAKAGWRRVGILATDGTIQAGLYQQELSALGVIPVTPAPEVQALVMNIIYDEIKRGEQGSREKFAAIDRHLRTQHCDGAILACTELSVFRVWHNLPAFYLDAMEVLAEESITACGYPLRTV